MRECVIEARRARNAGGRRIFVSLFIAPCIVLSVLALCRCALAERNAARGNLLVDVYGELIIVRPDGSQWSVAEGVNCAALSPDGKQVAYTTAAQNLTVMLLDGGAARELVKLPADAYFEEIGWAPDGSAIAFEAIERGKRDYLSLLTFGSDSIARRDLGPWYQGFSFSPDGARIVHAVNGPVTSGLEVLDLATEKRTMVHTAKDVVWDARFSPDGRFIAYRMTIRSPEGPEDEPDCTPPTLGLRLYSIGDGIDVPVTVRDAPEDWDNVKTYAWSPDGKRIALTLGTTDCDYPGSTAGVFLTSVDMKSQARLSTTDMAFEPVFSPDGETIAFVDFSESPARLFRYDASTGVLALIRRATEENNYYRLVDWK